MTTIATRSRQRTFASRPDPSISLAAFVGSTSLDFTAIDVTTKTAPTVLKSVPFPTYWGTIVATDGSYAWVGGVGQLHVIDV